MRSLPSVRKASVSDLAKTSRVVSLVKEEAEGRPKTRASAVPKMGKEDEGRMKTRASVVPEVKEEDEGRPKTRASVVSKRSVFADRSSVGTKGSALVDKAYQDNKSSSIKAYIKDLEDRLLEEKLRRIKSENMLKELKFRRN